MLSIATKETLTKFKKNLAKFFAPPEPRIVGTCIKTKGNIQTHTPVEIITDPETGLQHCNCPAYRSCIQNDRVVANSKPATYQF